MKKYIRFLAMPAFLWVLGMGLILPAAGCNRSTTESGSETIGTDDSAPPGINPTAVSPDTHLSGTPATDLSDKPVSNPTDAPASTEVPTTTPVPTPIAVNTDTSTVTYLVNREYTLSEDFVPDFSSFIRNKQGTSFRFLLNEEISSSQSWLYIRMR